MRGTPGGTHTVAGSRAPCRFWKAAWPAGVNGGTWPKAISILNLPIHTPEKSGLLSEVRGRSRSGVLLGAVKIKRIRATPAVSRFIHDNNARTCKLPLRIGEV